MLTIVDNVLQIGFDSMLHQPHVNSFSVFTECEVNGGMDGETKEETTNLVEGVTKRKGIFSHDDLISWLALCRL